MGAWVGGGAWTVCRSMGELGKKEEGGVFEGVGLIPQCTLCMLLLVFCLAKIELYFNALLHSK